MNEIEESKRNYSQALERLARLSPEFAQAFPDPNKISVAATGLETQGERALELKVQLTNRAARRRQERHGQKQMRGLGRIYKPCWRDRKTGERRESPTWWIAYNHRGKAIRESAHSHNRTDAVKLLKRRHGEISAGKPTGPNIEKTTLSDLEVMIVNDYKANQRKSLARLQDAITHLKDYFGEPTRAVEIGSDRVTAYVTYRQNEKAKNATINYELSALVRMFVLGIRAGKVATKPYITKLATNNARKGFFEHGQFEAVLLHLPEDIKPVIEVAYFTGWRIDSEILTRQRHHVDLKAGWLRLDPNESKNREGRQFPLTPRLREVLERQIAKTEALQKELGKIVPHLFHRRGAPIKTFRRSWLTACKKAGVPGKIRHDFRRTACRNLARAGIERTTAMKAVGHLTESIYRRYSIVDECMLKEAAIKLEQLHASDEQKSRNGKAMAK